MLKQYLNEIFNKYKTGQAQEHSYRKTLEDLLRTIDTGIQVINEPKKQKCGKPDYIILKKNIPVGYIEAKDIDKNLNSIEKDEQINRYRTSLDNLILTNYLEFWFYVHGERVAAIKIADIENGKIKAQEHEYTALINYLRNFCNYAGQTIKSPQQLAQLMAQKATVIRDVIIKTLELHDKEPFANQEYNEPSCEKNLKKHYCMI